MDLLWVSLALSPLVGRGDGALVGTRHVYREPVQEQIDESWPAVAEGLLPNEEKEFVKHNLWNDRWRSEGGVEARMACFFAL